MRGWMRVLNAAETHRRRRFKGRESRRVNSCACALGLAESGGGAGERHVVRLRRGPSEDGGHGEGGVCGTARGRRGARPAGRGGAGRGGQGEGPAGQLRRRRRRSGRPGRELLLQESLEPRPGRGPGQTLTQGSLLPLYLPSVFRIGGAPLPPTARACALPRGSRTPEPCIPLVPRTLPGPRAPGPCTPEGPEDSAALPPMASGTPVSCTSGGAGRPCQIAPPQWSHPYPRSPTPCLMYRLSPPTPAAPPQAPMPLSPALPTLVPRTRLTPSPVGTWLHPPLVPTPSFQLRNPLPQDTPLVPRTPFSGTPPCIPRSSTPPDPQSLLSP
ncbi:uncharacterized protein LOC127557561 [Antechinus flavipes]|uniref:uncharacterized protein LOC127557561 n=1 Tax=Antechinus flavipes TaxID=38775 RepID=UPI002235BBD0|nr:uncharacterized protein LOC127557561 [Antechinus flavipes]